MRRKLSHLTFFHTLYHTDSSFVHSYNFLARISCCMLIMHIVQPVYVKMKTLRNFPLVLSVAESNALPSYVATIRTIASLSEEPQSHFMVSDIPSAACCSNQGFMRRACAFLFEISTIFVPQSHLLLHRHNHHHVIYPPCFFICNPQIQ